MAEDESDQESERLVEELEAIVEEQYEFFGASGLWSREYCRRFCEVVEDYTARWQVPLPQLQVLQTALCCFTSASVSFPAECEHTQCVLSRLALSLFELLLFFGKDEFYEVPLKEILGSVQECHSLLKQYDNKDLRLVVGIIKDGGPWEQPVLQAILKGKSEPQDTVDKYLKSEHHLFIELRVRYLIACERIPEAMALITTCLSHPEVSKNLYYHQAYFMCLHITRLTEQLLQEHVLRIDIGDGVKIICNTENEGKTALALQLSEAFLITQLQSGDMYCVWDLIFLWSKLQLKLNHSKQLFIEQCYNMLRIVTNLKGIFPFMKAIINEIGEAGVQLSVELCGCALQLDLNHDPETKSLIYKTIACLLPTDLEICRICVLSVFFLERTMETYYAVERLYKCSDEDYNEFTSYVENRVRFELLPILKRGLIFDPEFWNFSMIQENCFAFLQNKTSLDNVTNKEIVTQALPIEATKSVKDSINGVLELEHSTNVKNSTIFASYKMDHNNVPRHLCTLCNKEFLGGHIFRHAQAHQKRGCFSCVICARKFRNRFIMLKHLKSHISKIQRRHMAALAAISNDTLNETPNTNEVHLSDASSLCIENENSSSSTKVLSDVLVATHQESSPESLVPVENHVIENNNNDKPNNLTDLIISENNLELIDKQLFEENLDSNLPDLVKINGSLCSMNEDPAIKDNVLNHQDVFECPAQGCDRTFKRICNLNKHARKTHPTDLKVQQHILTWNKGKCRFCQRLFTDSKHFIEHLQRHVYPNVYFCPFVNCNESFKLLGQLTEHKASHTKCIVQCSYINCCELFEDFSMLYKHEAEHYEQTALKAVNPLTALEPKCNATDLSEPFKQIPAVPKESMDKIRKPKVVDFPVPIWKSKKDLAEPKTYTQTEKKMNGYIISENSLLDSSTTSEVKNNPSLVLEANVESPTDEEKNINGYSVREKTHANDIHFNCAHSTQKPLETVSDTVLEGPQESSADQEQNPSKPKSNTGIVSCGKVWPFSRPLPSAYLDEQYISMPKRRKADEEHKFEIDTNCTKSLEMFRCGKCLTNYCSSEALEKHRAQNKCQQYFGFDSDDESAW